MSNAKERIVHYVAQGIQPVQIASILGVSPQYISEVQNDPAFSVALAAVQKTMAKTLVEEKHEEDYVKLESSVLRQIKESLPFAEFHDLTRLMDSLIKRKQSIAQVPGGIVHNTTTYNTVVLKVPQVVAPDILINERREVIAVDGRTMAPMTTQGVRSLFEILKEKRELKALETRTALPTNVEVLVEDAPVITELELDF